MKVVIDTNTLISGLFWSGPPRQILNLARERKIELHLNESILKEFSRVLRYPKFGLSDDDLKPIIKEILSIAIMNAQTCTQSFIPQDPADDIVVRCAVDSSADCLVTGDHHILWSKAAIGAKIMSAAEFLAYFDGTGKIDG